MKGTETEGIRKDGVADAPSEAREEGGPDAREGRATPSSAAARAVSLGEEPEREMWERAARLPPQDPTVRMFEKEWMEKLSRVHPLVPHALFVPVVAFMVWRSLSLGTGALATAGLALLGLLAWTVTEFLLHRYVFHEIATEQIERSVARKAHRLAPDRPIVPNLDGWREKFYFVAHGVHHEFPSDPRRLVMPPSVSVPLAVLFWLLFSALLGPMATPGADRGGDVPHGEGPHAPPLLRQHEGLRGQLAPVGPAGGHLRLGGAGPVRVPLPGTVDRGKAEEEGLRRATSTAPPCGSRTRGTSP